MELGENLISLIKNLLMNCYCSKARCRFRILLKFSFDLIYPDLQVREIKKIMKQNKFPSNIRDEDITSNVQVNERFEMVLNFQPGRLNPYFNYINSGVKTCIVFRIF